MNRYYIYTHSNPSTGIVFYIGKGTRNRAWSNSGRTQAWIDQVARSGFLVTILSTDLTNSDATNLENKLLENPLPEWELVNKSKSRRHALLTSEYFSKFVYYDSDSPSGLRWKVDISKKMRKGSIVGSKKQAGYWYFRCQGVKYHNHRVIMALLHGSLSPDMVVNHIDSNPSNNLSENLEVVTPMINAHRTKRNISALSVGVHLRNNRGLDYWVASWTDHSGRSCKKYFNCDTHGYSVARQLAIDYRRNRLLELNATGAGYRNLGD